MNVKHYGFTSSIKYDNLTPWFTTTETDQIITFKDDSDQQVNVNSLYIESESTALYIRILPHNYCIYLDANDSRNIDFKTIQKIQVMGAIGQKLRYSAMYY